MSFPTVRVSPDPKYSAEVVVLLTTLGAKRSEFNAGKRARDLLEIKRVHHKIVDFNRDARQAGTGEAENQAIQTLMVQGKLQTGDNDDLILPQIFIDGQYIGDANALQGLEDDKILEDILLRRACMKCYDKYRAPDSKQCACCGAKFEEILPGLMTIEQVLRELAMTAEADYDEEYEAEYDAEHEPPSHNNHSAPRAWTNAGSQAGAQSGQKHGQQPEKQHAPAAASSPAPPPAPRTEASRASAVGGSAVAPPQAAAAQVHQLPQLPQSPPPVATGPPAPLPTMQQLAPPKAAAAGAAAAGSSPTYKQHIVFKVGESVQYWSETKKRWVDACVEAKHEKDGVVKYDLNCKRGAPADKLRRPVAR